MYKRHSYTLARDALGSQLKKEISSLTPAWSSCAAYKRRNSLAHHHIQYVANTYGLALLRISKPCAFPDQRALPYLCSEWRNPTKVSLRANSWQSAAAAPVTAAPAANHRGTADWAAVMTAVVRAEDASTTLTAARAMRRSLKFLSACSTHDSISSSRRQLTRPHYYAS